MSGKQIEKGEESSSAKNRVEDELSLLTDSSLVLVSYTNIPIHLPFYLSIIHEEENSTIREEEEEEKKRRVVIRFVRLERFNEISSSRSDKNA